ncbi:MAG: AAA family ATPase, partial [Aureliella sp.]
GSRLVSGMSGLGMWQERCLKLIREAHATRAVLHVGSVVELMEAGKIDGQPGVASMIRQAIARGRLLVIAECTPQQVALIEREEPLLLRAMVRYDLQEPEPQEVGAILRQAAQYRVAASARKESQRCRFTDEALEELHQLHRRYASYSALPAQPLRLMQTILERSPPGAVITASDVARVFSSQTGLPRFLVDDSESIDLEQIRQQLAGHVIGQREPVDMVVNLIATLKTRKVRPGRPLASLLFIGPTGVGKTEMAKALAGLLYSDTRRMVRIDMSEYASPWSAVRLIGRPDEGDGTLTSPIREQPFSVVLLDEFEKADPTVFDMLLQLLGEGRLTDSLGRLADFRNAVVIMTSNLGVESFRHSGFGFAESGSDWRTHFEREVQRFVRPELLGRIDRIVPFAPLSRDVVAQIAQRELNLLKERPGLKYADVHLEFAPEVIERLCQLGYQPKYGARPLRRAIEQHVTVPLANVMSNLTTNSAWTLRAELRDETIAISSRREDSTEHQRRKSAESAIDAWQTLGRMARLAMNCSPLRDLENETQRLQRINDTLFEKLKETSQSRRANNLKQEIQVNAVTIERNSRIVEELAQASNRIAEEHQQVMLDWYRNAELSSERLFELPERLQQELRTAVVGLLVGRIKALEVATLLIIGKPIARAAVLFKAYDRIAAENGWKVDYYSLRAYEPAHDRESPEYRKRQSQRKTEEGEPPGDREPAMRLLGRTTSGDATQLVKTCDVYREKNSDAWLNAEPSVSGIAMQLGGFGIQGWLSNEVGIIHFLDSGGGPKRRLRFRVMLEQHRLVDVQLGQSWQEPVALPERDPRRTFHQVDNTIVDGLTGETITCPQSKQLDCLIDAIGRDRERQLWSAIDFTGIPAGATLQGEEPETLVEHGTER